jgi:hypothetical protein
MNLPNLFRRRLFETAALLILGFALVTIAFRLLTSFAFDHLDHIAFSFWGVGCTLIGAGALCPFRRAFSGGLIGFIVGVYLTITPANTDVDANETFKEVADKIAATHAESDGHSSAATSTSPQQSRSD